MVRGDAGTIEQARPVLSTFGAPVIHLGPLGSGQIAKVLNNFVFTAQLAVALETFQFASDLGLGQAAIAEVLANGSGGSRAASSIARGGYGTQSLTQLAGTIPPRTSPSWPTSPPAAASARHQN